MMELSLCASLCAHYATVRTQNFALGLRGMGELLPKKTTSNPASRFFPLTHRRQRFTIEGHKVLHFRDFEEVEEFSSFPDFFRFALFKWLNWLFGGVKEFSFFHNFPPFLENCDP